MTQILGYRSPAGIILATDSRAQHYQDDGTVYSIQVRKLFRLSPHIVLVTAGAGYGLPVSASFQAYVKHKSLWSMKQIYYQALPFFRSALQQFIKHDSQPTKRPELDRVYFLFAGYDIENNDEPFRFQLLGSEQPEDDLHPIPTSHVVTIPRQLGLESRLFRKPLESTRLKDVETLMKRFLIRLARETNDVGFPLYIVRISSGGIAIQTRTTITGRSKIP